MQNGWIKLHRKLLDNPLLRRDASAYIVFTKLLLTVDRKTGSYDIGRFQMAELTGLKPTTAYAASARLCKAKMMTQVSNNRFTTITICNWAKYQGYDDNYDDNKMTTNRQQDDTKQEAKKLRSKNIVPKGTITVDKRDPEITRLIGHFETRIGKMPRKDHQVYAAATLIKQHGAERSLGAINAVAASRGNKFAPSISTLEELVEKWIKLETFYQREVTSKPKGVKIR